MKIDHTTRQYFVYSVKVWMGSVLAAPAAFFIIGLIRSPDHNNPGAAFITIYLLFVAFELVFSLLTWLMFWMLTMLIVININNRNIQRWLVALIGIGLTLATFTLFAPMFDNPFRPNSTMFALMLINTICIGCGAWLFYPDRPQHLQPTNSKSNFNEQ